VVVRRSELSSKVSFTPSGAGTAARVTKSAAISEGETHWELYVSVDDNLYFYLTRTAVGTTTYDDSADPFSASGNAPAPLAGAHTVPVSAKYLLVDGNRLLLAGAWETSTAFTSRVWFTPRLGTGDSVNSSFAGDDESIPDTVEQENWIDLDEKDGDAITGLGGPFEGMPIVFKYRHIWGLRPTGSLIAPYQPIIISKVVGSIRQQSVVMAEDENGSPAIYFLSHRGPYRFGTRGLQYMGEDVKDIWFGDEDREFDAVNLDASTVSCFGVHHSDKHQIWWWVAQGSTNTPDRILVFDTRLGEPDEDNQVRGGFTTFLGTPAEARCGVMFSNTLGASMSTDLKPYIGTSSTATLTRGDSGLLDRGSPFAASVTLPEQHLAGLSHFCQVNRAIVMSSAGPHIFMLQMFRDYGLERRDSEVNMTPEGDDQTRTQRTIEASFQADAKSVGAKIGDICPIAHPWTIDALVIQFDARQEQ